MKNIKKFFRFVFVYLPLNQVQAHATKWQIFKFWCRNGFRRLVMVVMFIALGASSAFVYRELNPKVVNADPIIREVVAEQKLSDYPILVKICNAESGGKQFKANGDVVRGRVNPSDIGICQINEAINNDQARKLGFDIFTQKGNEQMAIWMFVHEGTAPWNSSKAGWSK